MTRENVVLQSYNRGIISKLALARTDLKRTALSAEIQHNYMPRSLGSMMLRPGTEYVGGIYNDLPSVSLPFVFSVDDTAIIELTDSLMRVRVDEVIITRVSVSTAITNGTFNTDLSSWTDVDETGATSAWSADGGGSMALLGTGFNAAMRQQTVSVAGGDLNKEHALNINIVGALGTVGEGGSVSLRVGSTVGGDEYIGETELSVGYHSLALTPTGNIYITLFNRKDYTTYVNSIAIAAAGDMTLATEWTESDLPYVRLDQSGDVLFMACDGRKQRKIERRGTNSWSIVAYQPEDGPFRGTNITPIKLTPSAISGDITLSASASFFKTTHVGALFRLTSVGQTVSSSINGADQWSDYIRVTGVGSSRLFSISISGVWAGTITLQRSIGEIGSWENVANYTASTTYTDSLDNQIIFYRIGFSAYTSGTATVGLSYSSGSITGIVRVRYFLNNTSVSANVVKHLGGTNSTTEWDEGEWSDYRGYPSAVCFYEGRLWWAGKDKIIASVSDAFNSFDDTIDGDSASISRSIGSGPVDSINWLLPLLRLMVGTQTAERSVRSSSLDEPITTTNFNLKVPSTRGSSPVSPGKTDSSGLFVRLNRLFELSYNETYSVTSDYAGNDLSILCPEVGGGRIVKIAVQRYPDTRIHCIRDDGQVAILIFDKAEDVKCWVTGDTQGEIEDVLIMPALDGETEDKVYYTVKRTVARTTKRFFERWAFENECAGGTTIYDSDSATVLDADYPDGTIVTLRDSSGTKIGNNLTVSDGQITLASAVTYATITPSIFKHADSHVNYSGVATTTFTAAHLAGLDVVIWGDGIALGTYTLNASGQVTIPSVETYCGGLGYTAQYKSTKLAYAAEGGTALTQRKIVYYLGVILSNTHISGLTYGMDFDNMDALPLMEDGAEVDADFIYASYDKDSFEFPGDYDTDSRLCLQSEAPYPCTLLASVIGMQTNAK